MINLEKVLNLVPADQLHKGGSSSSKANKERRKERRKARKGRRAFHTRLPQVVFWWSASRKIAPQITEEERLTMNKVGNYNFSWENSFPVSVVLAPATQPLKRTAGTRNKEKGSIFVCVNGTSCFYSTAAVAVCNAGHWARGMESKQQRLFTQPNFYPSNVTMMDRKKGCVERAFVILPFQINTTQHSFS